MKIRAAVLEEFGAAARRPGRRARRPQGGRGARARRGLRRLPHRPLHGQRRRPDGLRAVRARARGRGRRRGRRRGRHERAQGRSRDHAVRARVRQVRPLPQPAHEPLHRDPRAAGSRLPAGRHVAPRARRRDATALHGHLDVRRGDRDARDRAREGRSPDVPPEGASIFACGLSTGLGAAFYTAQVEAGIDLRRVRLRAGRPRCRGGLPLARRRADRRDRPLGGAPRDGAPPRRDAHDAGRRRSRRCAARAHRRLRLRLHLRGHRQRQGHAPGGRVGARGLGARDDDRRRRARASCSRSCRAS